MLVRFVVEGMLIQRLLFELLKSAEKNSNFQENENMICCDLQKKESLTTKSRMESTFYYLKAENSSRKGNESDIFCSIVFGIVETAENDSTFRQNDSGKILMFSSK